MRRLWRFAHNVVAHPLMEALPECWGDALHDWTADRAFIVQDGPRFTEADVREAIRRERERYDSTVTHPDAEDEVLNRLREMQAEREAPAGGQ